MSSSSAPKSPHDMYIAKQTKYFDDNPQYLGSMLIKGLTCDDNEEEELDTSALTQEHMDDLRYVLVTQKRSDKLDAMRDLVLGDQADERMLMFNTSFSYHIRDSLHTLKKLLAKEKKPSDKFDLLFAYTHSVKEYNVWMHDNEGGMNEFTSGLAGIWKRMLKKSNEDLGMDEEYTKPGVLAFLEQFKGKIESGGESYGEGYDMTFKYA